MLKKTYYWLRDASLIILNASKMMNSYLKLLGRLILCMIVGVHAGFIMLLFTPTTRLISKLYDGIGLIKTEEIPATVKNFLDQHPVTLRLAEPTHNNLPEKIFGGILDIRQKKFMDKDERLALALSLLHYKEVTGLKQAAEYYFRKPLTGLSDKQWITLVNLHYIKQTESAENND